MNRPLASTALNPTKVDNSTDTWDTIDWPVKNAKESNGRVGTIRISHDGLLSLTPLIHPHPALKAPLPTNPMLAGCPADARLHTGALSSQQPRVAKQRPSPRRPPWPP